MTLSHSGYVNRDWCTIYAMARRALLLNNPISSDEKSAISVRHLSEREEKTGRVQSSGPVLVDSVMGTARNNKGMISPS